MITGVLRRLLCLLICLGALACTLVRAQGLDVGVPDKPVSYTHLTLPTNREV